MHTFSHFNISEIEMYLKTTVLSQLMAVLFLCLMGSYNNGVYCVMLAS